MTDPRSAAAMAGVCDEQRLVRDVLKELHDAETVTACACTWMRYVSPVEASTSPETIAQLGRALRIRMAILTPFE
jgi:hypothetical protein